MALTRQTRSFHHTEVAGTKSTSGKNSVERSWYVVDASDVPLGRLASNVASVLRGKNKPTFTPNGDAGDFVVVLNADRVKLTGAKLQNKFAYRHSGYPGGLREDRYDRLVETKPTFVIEKAVRGMLPKNTLGRKMLKKLKVYTGSAHPHEAQNPSQLTLRT